MRPDRLSRDPWFDNAKMALVILVVVGHTWTLLPESQLSGHLYDFVYAWHVPAFVFVTGYLSRSFDYSPARMWQLVRTVAVPYVVFEGLMAMFRIHVGGEELDSLFTDPHWPMWYLAALFCWRLLTPLFRPMVGGFALAVVLSVGAGLWAGDTLDLARVFGLLPFFVLGLKATPERLEWLRGRFPRLLAIVVFGAIGYLTAHTDRFISTEWLYYRAQYAELDISDNRAMVVRLALLGIGCVGALAFFALVPRTGGWFARMGSATLVVYLFHGFVVKGMAFAGFREWAPAHPVAAVAITTVAGIAMSLLLAWRPLASRLQVLVDPLGSAQQRVKQAVDLSLATEQRDRRPVGTMP